MNTPMEKSLLDSITVQPHLEGEAIHAQFVLADDFAGFSGHFPGAPICPGVAQLDAAVLSLKIMDKVDYRIVSVENAKFTRPLRPGEPLSIKITRLDAGKVSAVLKCEEEQVAKFKMTLRRVDDA